jgi:hypothetical protein
MASLPHSDPRVAIYTRGTARATDQERVCRDHAATRGYTIAPDHVYHEARLGTAHAPHLGLAAAVTAVRQHEVAAIIVAGPDRISRDPAWLARVEREVQQAGGRIEYAQEDSRWL